MPSSIWSSVVAHGVTFPRRLSRWKTVYHVFRQWANNHQWAVLNDTLRILVRKKPTPSVAAPLPPFWTVKVSSPPALVVTLGMTPASGSKAANAICWWILWGWYSAWW